MGTRSEDFHCLPVTRFIFRNQMNKHVTYVWHLLLMRILLARLLWRALFLLDQLSTAAFLRANAIISYAAKLIAQFFNKISPVLLPVHLSYQFFTKQPAVSLFGVRISIASFTPSASLYSGSRLKTECDFRPFQYEFRPSVAGIPLW